MEMEGNIKEDQKEERREDKCRWELKRREELRIGE